MFNIPTVSPFTKAVSLALSSIVAFFAAAQLPLPEVLAGETAQGVFAALIGGLISYAWPSTRSAPPSA